MPPGNRDIHETPRAGESPDLPKSDHDLLIRIYERQVSQDARLKNIEEGFEKMDERYVTHTEFWPVRAIVYSGAALILIAVLTAVVALVVKGGLNVQVRLDQPANTSLAFSGRLP